MPQKTVPPAVLGNRERDAGPRASARQTAESNCPYGGASAAPLSGLPFGALIARRRAFDHSVEDAFALPPLAAATPAGPPVLIFWINGAGHLEIEGLACQGAPTRRKPLEHWVTFVGESRPRRRLVLPEPYQSQADAILRGLQALYAEAGSPDFPDLFLTDVLRASAANDNDASEDEEA